MSNDGMGDDRDEDAVPADRGRARAEEAERVIAAIAAGEDPAEQALRFSNGFTDDVTGRMRNALGRMFRRR